jgi:alcohol dehydrogenase class IV
MFSRESVEKSDSYHTDSFLELIQSWKEEMRIPRLMDVGITPADFNRIIEVTENKNNPVPLTSDEMREALETAS